SRIVWAKDDVFGVQDRHGNLFNFYNTVKQTDNGIKITENKPPKIERADNKSFEKFVDNYKPTDTGYTFTLKRDWETAAACGEVLNICFSRGKVYVCTKENGLYVFSSTKSFSVIDMNSTQGNLPSNTVTAAVALDDKTLWIGTNKGMVIFDGLNYKPVDAQDSTFAENVVTDLASDDKRVYIATSRGLTVANKSGNWNQYNEDNGGLPINELNSVVTYKNKMGVPKVLLASKKGAFVFDENCASEFDDKLSGLWITDIVDDLIKPRGFWFCSPGGVYFFPRSEDVIPINSYPSFWNQENGLPQNWIVGMGSEGWRDQNNRDKINKIIWFASRNTIFTYQDGNWENYPLHSNGIIGKRITKIRVKNGKSLDSQQDNEIWVGTDRGVSVYANCASVSEVPSGTTIVPPGNPEVSDIKQYLGDTWIATEKGLCNLTQAIMYDDGFSCDWPLIDSRIRQLEIVDKKYMVIVPSSGGLLFWNGQGTPSVLNQENCDFPGPDFDAVYFDKSTGEIYCALTGSGSANSRLFHFPYDEPRQWLWVDEEMNKPQEKRIQKTDDRYVSASSINSIRKLGDVIYIGTDGEGLFVIKNNKWTQIKAIPQASHGLAGNKIRDMKIDRFENLWIATESGLNRFSPNGKWDTFKAGVDMGICYSNFYSVEIEDKNTYQIWAAAADMSDEGGGIIRFDGKNWLTFGVPNVRHLLKDRNGIWADVRGFGMKKLGQKTMK
ncbi:hypothetical protein KAJ27_07860, partial [bacterium]|nr:hypothetical protein [bacterium]